MAGSRPTVIISAAMSVDGRIATKGGDSRISSRKDLVRVHKLRSEVDAILIGANTMRRDDPLLTVRHTKGRNPTRIILDSRGTIPTKSRIIHTAKRVPTIIAVSESIPKRNLDRLERLPVEIMVCGDGRVDTKKLLRRLASRGIGTLLVEGGGATNWDFIKNGIFDRLVITISPKIIGGAGAISLVQGSGFPRIKGSPELRLDEVKKSGDELVLHYSKSTD